MGKSLVRTCPAAKLAIESAGSDGDCGSTRAKLRGRAVSILAGRVEDLLWGRETAAVLVRARGEDCDIAGQMEQLDWTEK